jgi:alpha-glucosidase/alpha-D-xyloside xylohydrolase
MIYLGTGFCPSGWNTGHGSFTFNDTVFPDPVAMFQELHADHFKVILHVVPPGDMHGTVEDTGMAAKTPGDAVTYWAKHIPVEQTGVDGWWPDEGDRLSTYVRLARNQMYWDGSVKLHPDRRPFALHRNGYAGLQRYGWLWSGDVYSTWETLRAQVMVGINVGLSGIPFWGTDTGGFVPTKELTPELYVRWFQFSSFCPSFRAHGRAWKLRLPWGWNLGKPGLKEMEGAWTQDWPQESDLHRPDVEDICRKYLNLRYQLLPYLYSTVAQAHATGLPLMRALWVSYPTDPKLTLIDDAYLWGDGFLVVPVYEKDASQRTTYLPAGTWWDYWSGDKVQGGRELTRKVDLATMPLYVRAGSIIPIGLVKQYTAEATDEPVTLRIYPGADGNFTWYDDDGSSFRYETGEYLRVECEWKDQERLLTLTRDPKGRFGAGRKFRAQLHGEDHAQNASLRAGVTRVHM